MTEEDKAKHVHEGLGRRRRRRSAPDMAPSDERLRSRQTQRADHPPPEAVASLAQPTSSESLNLQSSDTRPAANQVDRQSLTPPTATQPTEDMAAPDNTIEESDRVATPSQHNDAEPRTASRGWIPLSLNSLDSETPPPIPTQYTRSAAEQEQIAAEIRHLMEGEPGLAEDILDTANIRRGPPVASGYTGRAADRLPTYPFPYPATYRQVATLTSPVNYPAGFLNDDGELKTQHDYEEEVRMYEEERREARKREREGR